MSGAADGGGATIRGADAVDDLRDEPVDRLDVEQVGGEVVLRRYARRRRGQPEKGPLHTAAESAAGRGGDFT